MAGADPIIPETSRLSIRLPHWRWLLLGTGVLIVVAVGLQFGLPINLQHPFEVQWVHAKYAYGVEFIGVRGTESASTTFFSIRVEGHDGKAIDPECPVVLTWAGKKKWSGKKWRIGDLTAEAAASSGIVLKPINSGQPGDLAGFIGGADDQNRDYGIEFRFHNQRLTEFYARHNRESSVPCPFTIVFDGKPAMAFPVTEATLLEACGKPESMSAHWGN